MLHISRLTPFALAVALAACATVPDGPSVMAMPGTGRNLDQFRADDAYCRDFALQMSGGKTANQNAVDSGISSAAVGTLIGAAAGAALGGHNGAGAGAGTGLLMGGLIGTETSQRSAHGTQRRYDNAYVQCMYEKGDRVPVSGHLQEQRSSNSYAPPPGASMPPPPAPNMPPPPMAESNGAGQLFVYPRHGQSEAQTAADRRACATWASDQTGYEPGRGAAGDPRRGDYQRAAAACLDGRGYTAR